MKGVSVPEPPPINKGEVVPTVLINYLQLFSQNFSQNVNNEARTTFQESMTSLVSLIEQRDNFGRAKYGQPLMSQDGRNGVEDAKQELGDLLQYVMKCKLSGQVIPEKDVNLFLTGIVVLKRLLLEKE